MAVVRSPVKTKMSKIRVAIYKQSILTMLCSRKTFLKWQVLKTFSAADTTSLGPIVSD